jgi:hypothetical protein
MAIQAEWADSQEVGRCMAHEWHGMVPHRVLAVRVGSIGVRLCDRGVEELRAALDGAPPEDKE